MTGFLNRAAALAWLAVMATGSVAFADPPQLTTFNSRFYEIRTNLPKERVVWVGQHMDVMCAHYRERFAGFDTRMQTRSTLVLLATREDYLTLLASFGIEAGHTGGMYLPPGYGANSGLYVYIGDQNTARVRGVLQHEGLHQFAADRFGYELPTWLNEGMAEYFEHAIIVGRTMKTGLAPRRRLLQVRQAMEDDTALGFTELVETTGQQWHDRMKLPGPQGALQYAQSWSIVHFLAHADGGKYRRALERYLKLLSEGRDSGRAMRMAFGLEDLAPAERRWRKYIMELEPDPIADAVEKIEFLGHGIAWLQNNGQPVPDTLDGLKAALQERGFYWTWGSHGAVVRIEAKDDASFQFLNAKGQPAPFVLASSGPDLPPTVSAPGLKPHPRLVWSRAGDSGLVQAIEYQ